MKMPRFVAALAAAAMLCACGPQGVASAGSAPPRPATASIVDKAALESTRALVLAELSYEAAAATALKLIQTGVIRGPAALRVRDANATCTKALIAGKAATTAAQRLAQANLLRGAIANLRNLLPGEAPDEVR